MMITKKRQPYFVAKSLEAANLGTIDYESYEETEDGKKSIMISYEPSAECAAIISNAFKTRGLKRESKPAVVSSEVKAAEVETTTELVKEDNSMNNMITLAPAELNALLTAARSSVVDTTSQIIYRDREIVPADYEQLKKDLESARKTAATWQSKATDLEKQIAELKAQIAASSKVDTHVPTLKEDLADEKFEQEVKDAFDSPFNDDFCDFNKAINLVAEAEVREKKKKADAAEEAKRKGIVTKYFDAYSAYHFVKGNLDYIKNACPDKKKWQSFADEIEDYDCFTAEEITFVRDVAYA